MTVAFDPRPAERRMARLIARRRCPACENGRLRPFRFPAGVWGFRCVLCGEAAILGGWATRGHRVWQGDGTTYEDETG